MVMSTSQAALLLMIIRLHHAAMKGVLFDTHMAPDPSLIALVMISRYLYITLSQTVSVKRQAEPS